MSVNRCKIYVHTCMLSIDPFFCGRRRTERNSCNFSPRRRSLTGGPPRKTMCKACMPDSVSYGQRPSGGALKHMQRVYTFCTWKGRHESVYHQSFDTILSSTAVLETSGQYVCRTWTGDVRTGRGWARATSRSVLKPNQMLALCRHSLDIVNYVLVSIVWSTVRVFEPARSREANVKGSDAAHLHT